MMDVVLLGPPGAGKGTQAVGMSTRFHLKHISTGDLLRVAVKEGTALGKEAESFMKQGALVPDELILKLIQEALPEDQGVLFDGFPRNVLQAKALREVLEAKHRTLSAVINLSLADEDVIQRLCGRRQCANCGAIYHVDHNPTEKEGVCDKCGGEVYQRADDQESTIKNRIAVYHEQTKPLVEFYTNENLIESVDAGKAPEVVGKMVDERMEARRG